MCKKLAELSIQALPKKLKIQYLQITVMNELWLASLLLNTQTFEEHEKLYSVFDGFPLVTNVDDDIRSDDSNVDKLVPNFRAKIERTHSFDHIHDIDCDSATLYMDELCCDTFVRNVTVDVLSNHTLSFVMPVKLNSIKLGVAYNDPSGRHFELRSSWFINDFYDNESDMSTIDDDDEVRHGRCNYLDLFDHTPVKVESLDGGPIELPIVVKYSWESVHMLYQEYGLNHYKKSNQIEWEGDRWTNQAISQPTSHN